MAEKPLIALTAAHVNEELATFPRHYYVESVRRAGGIPVIVPPPRQEAEAEEVLDRCDGIIFTGGGDISPVYLREQPRHGLGQCLPERDEGELMLAGLAIARDLPVFGICRGIQVLAVAAGGRICQDIASQHANALQHEQTAPRQYPWHEIQVLESSLQRLVAEKRILVNSFHHQAVVDAPPGFMVNALAPDGIIEGIERTGAKFCLGVQWHPESMENDVSSVKLFRAFIHACLS